jgi:hypothetical protein
VKKSQWLDLCGWMCQLWPWAPIDESAAVAWWPFIADRDATAVRSAIATLAVEPGRRYPPAIGDLLAHLDGAGSWREWADDVWSALVAVSNQAHDGSWRDRAGEHAAAWIDRTGGISPHRAEFKATDPFLRREFETWAKARHERLLRQRRQQMAGQALRQLPAGGR